MSITSSQPASLNTSTTAGGVETQSLTGNRFEALGEAGNNINKNNETQIALADRQFQQTQANNSMLLGQQQMNFNYQLDAGKLGLHDKTVTADTNFENTLSGSVGILNEKLKSTDDPRMMNQIMNQIASAGQTKASLSTNETTMTSQGHGSVGTNMSGQVGQTSNTVQGSFDAQLGAKAIDSNTQLGLGSLKSNTDLGLGGIQAGVSKHHTDAVGGVVAQGQSNYFSGMGSGSAGFTQGYSGNMNSNANASYNGPTFGGLGALSTMGTPNGMMMGGGGTSSGVGLAPTGGGGSTMSGIPGGQITSEGS